MPDEDRPQRVEVINEVGVTNRVQKWEYKRNTVLGRPEGREDDNLIQLGQEGWEAVCSLGDGQVLFKRPLK